MQDLERALAEITEIRTRVAGAQEFRGYGPVIVALTGLLGLAGGVLQASVPALQSVRGWLFLWSVIGLISIGLIFGEMALRRRHETKALTDADLWTAFERFLPAFFTGGALSLVLLRFEPGLIWLMPGLWSILFGLGMFAALPTLPRTIRPVAGWYLVCGLGVLIWTLQIHACPPAAMALPFGIGQLLLAVQLARAKS
jgi:hypothetical protein